MGNARVELLIESGDGNTAAIGASMLPYKRETAAEIPPDSHDGDDEMVITEGYR